MGPNTPFREVYRNGQVFGSRAGHGLVRVLRTLLIVAVCAFLLAYGVQEFRTGRAGRTTATAITVALMAVAAIAIPGTVAMELSAHRRLGAARRYVATGGRLACAEGHPRWRLDRSNNSGHASITSGRSTANVSGGSFAVGDQSWDLDEIAGWRGLYDATGRPGTFASLTAGGFALGGRGGADESLIVRAWYVPDTHILVGVEARPATPFDR